MSRKRVNAICRRFPGAEVSDPWGGGHDAWKVGGKMFACIGAVMPGVSVKTDSIETAEMLIDAGIGVRIEVEPLDRRWPVGQPLRRAKALAHQFTIACTALQHLLHIRCVNCLI